MHLFQTQAAVAFLTVADETHGIRQGCHDGTERVWFMSAVSWNNANT